MIKTISKLSWMTEEEYEAIYFHYACVCDYDMTWKDMQDYEAWCKRVLNK